MSHSDKNYRFFKMRGLFKGCGNIMSLMNNSNVLTPCCFVYLFKDCTSLVSAPELPALNPENASYAFMFKGCSNLTYIKVLLNPEGADVWNIYSTLYYWVDGVYSSGIFVMHIDATWVFTISDCIPYNWTVIYYDPTEDKYYTTKDKSVECDDHGNPLAA